MKRRTFLIGGSVAVLGVGAMGFAASETGMLTGEPTDSPGTTSSPGVYQFDTHGVSTVGWYPDTVESALLRVDYQSTPPDSYRLHRPDGTKVWGVTDATGESDNEIFGLPITRSGMWELVVSRAGSHTSLSLPVNLDFEIQNYGLRDETVIAEITNSTNSPNYIDYIRLSPDSKGYGEKYEPRRALMPGETYRLEEPYPFDIYKDIELAVVSHNTVPGTRVTKSFV